MVILGENSWVRDQVVSVILGDIPGYPNWLFWSYSGIYPVPNLVVSVILGVYTRVPYRVVLFILGYIPECDTRLF